MIFLFFFFFFNNKILGSQCLVSNDKKILFVNSGFSALKFLIIKNKNIVSNQKCIRMQGLYNDFYINNDGIHYISFTMLGSFNFNGNLFYALKIIIYFIKHILKIKKKKVFFTINNKDIKSFFFLYLLKINNIILTKKNIWKIKNNGLLGKCIEIYIKIKKKLLEIWNIVIINFFQKKFLKKIKFNIIDTGLGVKRLFFLNNFISKNIKILDLINSILLIINNNYITKNHYFLLNKLLNKMFLFSFKINVNFYKILYFFFKKKKKKNNIIKLLEKEIFFLSRIKKNRIININNYNKQYKNIGIPIYCNFYINKIIFL